MDSNKSVDEPPLDPQQLQQPQQPQGSPLPPLFRSKVPALYPSGYPGVAPYSGTGNYAARQGEEIYFFEKSMRMAFLWKVYTILMTQFLITAFHIALFLMCRELSLYLRRNTEWLWIAIVVTIICVLVILCFESFRRTPPTNGVLLFIFTYAASLLLAMISTMYEIQEILITVGMCAVVCFALMAFAMQTKIDFTAMGSVLLMVLVILIFSGLLILFSSAIRSKPASLVHACFGAFFFSLYLIVDTQMMIGGTHKYSILPEDYVFAVLCIYVDVFNIFLYVLDIISERRRSIR